MSSLLCGCLKQTASSDDVYDDRRGEHPQAQGARAWSTYVGRVSKEAVEGNSHLRRPREREREEPLPTPVTLVVEQRAVGSKPLLAPPTFPVNSRPAKHSVLVELVGAGFHPTDPIPLDTAVALVQAGLVMNVGIQLAGDPATSGDSVLDASDAAALCLRVLAAISNQARGSLSENQAVEHRRTAASDFAESTIYALRRGNAQYGQLCALISAAAQLDYPELREELLAAGMPDALAEVLVILAARKHPSRRFPRVNPVLPVAPGAAKACTPGAGKHFGGSVYCASAHSSATAADTPADDLPLTTQRVVAVSNGASQEGQDARHSNPLVPKLALRNVGQLAAGCSEVPNLGLTRSARRDLARKSRAEDGELAAGARGSTSSAVTTSSTTSAPPPGLSDTMHIVASTATRTHDDSHIDTVENGQNESSVAGGLDSLLKLQDTADATGSRLHGPGRTAVLTAAHELRSVATHVGETLMMSDFSAILAHNRRCRRNSGADARDHAESTMRIRAGAGASNSLSTRMEASPRFPPTTSSFQEASGEHVTSIVLDAVQALSLTRHGSSESPEANPVSELINSGLATEQHPTRLMAALSAILCVDNPKQPSHPDPSMRAACISALVVFQTPLLRKPPAGVDPLLLRLRGHIQIVYEGAASSKRGVTTKDEETTEGLLRLMGDYVRVATNLRHGEFAVVSEVLAYARTICVVGAAGARPSTWCAQRLRAVDAWLGAASDIMNRIGGNGDDSSPAELFASLLLGQQSTLDWVYEYADHMLFSEHAPTSRPGDGDVPVSCGLEVSATAQELAVVRRRTLSYFTALIKVVAIAFPPMKGRDSKGRDCDYRGDGSRAHALLSQLDFLIKPDTGFVTRILSSGGRHEGVMGDGFVDQKLHCVPSQPLEVCAAALLLAETAFSAPATPFLSSRVLIDTHVHDHFVSLLRLYSAPGDRSVQLSEGWADLVTGHLRVLMVMVRAEEIGRTSHWSGDVWCNGRCLYDEAQQQLQIDPTSSAARSVFIGLHGCGDGSNVRVVDAVAQSFHRLRVLDFLVREINLEYEISHRVSRVGKKEEPIPDEASKQTIPDVDDVSVRLPPTQGNAVSTRHPQTPDASSGGSRMPLIPALKLGWGPQISISDTALGNNESIGDSESADVGKHRGPNIPKLGLNLGNRSDGMSQTAVRSIPSYDSSDDDRPAGGFVGDLMEDVAREEELEEREILLRAKAQKGPAADDSCLKADGTQLFVEVGDGQEAAAAQAAEIALQSTHLINDQIVGCGTGDDPKKNSEGSVKRGGIAGQAICEAYDSQLRSQDHKDNSIIPRGSQGDQHRSAASSSQPWTPRVRALGSTHVTASAVTRPPSLLAATAPHSPSLQGAQVSNMSTTSTPRASSFQHSNMHLPLQQVDSNVSKKGEECLQIMDEASQTADSAVDIVYSNERKTRRLYCNERVHVTMLELLLALLVGADRKTDEDGGVAGDVGSLRSSPVHAAQLQLHNHKQNVTFFLRMHLNHASNASIIAPLTSAAVTLGRGAERLLRLSCDALFRPGRYAARVLVARGAYAQVHRCSLPSELGTLHASEVALKLVDTPLSTHDPTSAVDVYAEIAVFEALAQSPWVAKLFDYGVAGESFYIVMQHYPASLKQWRTAHVCGPGAGERAPQMLLYLSVYSQCIQAVAALEQYGVVHYDVKADNFLLEPSPGSLANDFWNPPVNTGACATDTDAGYPPLPFRVVITDFGESRMFVAGETPGTARNRGTEYIKSPEMLTVSNSSKKDVKSYDRRKYHKCGRPSDVWALGCLLYEILTDTYM